MSFRSVIHPNLRSKCKIKNSSNILNVGKPASGKKEQLDAQLDQTIKHNILRSNKFICGDFISLRLSMDRGKTA